MEDQKSYCPYCKIEIQKKPTRKTKCKNCNQYIFVNSSPNGKKRLVTEQESESIDKEWSDLYYEQMKTYKPEICKTYNISKEEYSNRKAILTSRFGREAFDNDISWMILNEQITLTKDPNEISNIYSQMASQLTQERKDSFEIQKQGYKFKLLTLQKAGIEKTEVSSVEHLCPHYKKLNKTILSIDEALKTMPIPRRDCTKIVETYEEDNSQEITYALCNCLYLGYFE